MARKQRVEERFLHAGEGWLGYQKHPNPIARAVNVQHPDRPWREWHTQSLMSESDKDIFEWATAVHGTATDPIVPPLLIPFPRYTEVDRRGK